MVLQYFMLESEFKEVEVPEEEEDTIHVPDMIETEVSTDPSVPKLTRSAIKKPQTGWMIFCGQHRASLMKGTEDTPALSITDCLKKMGEMYKDLSDEDRLALNELAALDKDRYRLELENCEEDVANEAPGVPSNALQLPLV